MGFLLPLIVVISTLTFILTFIVALAPTEDEIRADAAMQARIAELELQISERHAADEAAGRGFGRYGLPATPASSSRAVQATSPSPGAHPIRATTSVIGAVLPGGLPAT